MLCQKGFFEACSPRILALIGYATPVCAGRIPARPPATPSPNATVVRGGNERRRGERERGRGDTAYIRFVNPRMLAAFKRLFVEWNGGVCPSDSVGESEYGNALSLVGSIEAYRMQQPASHRRNTAGWTYPLCIEELPCSQNSGAAIQGERGRTVCLRSRSCASSTASLPPCLPCPHVITSRSCQRSRPSRAHKSSADESRLSIQYRES